jgi:hypothetical protein
MGLRLRFGIGPLRASVPLTGRRKRRRRSTASARVPTFHGITHLADGSVYTCHHAHRTEQAASECAEKYSRKVTSPTSSPPPWRPIAEWGTVRDYLSESAEGDEINFSFKFVPDDGSEPELVKLADTVRLEELGEYARGIKHAGEITIKVSAQAMHRAEHELFPGINQMELSNRKIMWAERNNPTYSNCGWAWTSDYTLVKAAPGLLD